MAATATPYGFRPVNLLGGRPYAGSTRAIKIASGYATNIFNGSLVTLLKSSGTIELLETDTGAAGSLFDQSASGFPIGVFVGCQYTDATLGFVSRNYWPTGQVATDAVAFVVDDPLALFQVQSAGSIAQAELGMNCGLNAVQSTSTGSTSTGNSNSAVTAAAVDTTGLAFRIDDFVESTTSTVGDAYTDIIVKFNSGVHAYDQPVGNTFT